MKVKILLKLIDNFQGHLQLKILCNNEAINKDKTHSNFKELKLMKNPFTLITQINKRKSMIQNQYWTNQKYLVNII